MSSFSPYTFLGSFKYFKSNSEKPQCGFQSVTAIGFFFVYAFFSSLIIAASEDWTSFSFISYSFIALFVKFIRLLPGSIPTILLSSSSL
ncbi:Uncharacterised protein [Streptococcus pneumoniae]|nr:Uncharacterised protein [Streptococcus pneumoniae]